MKTVLDIIHDFEAPCACGQTHRTTVRDVRIGSGLVHTVGDILTANHFPRTLLLVADRDTLRAADGILDSLKGFQVETHIYDSIRVATVGHVEELEENIRGRDIAILSVGSGSVNDPCRLAAARQEKPLCIFATAPSMDGFASYGAPLVADGFKSSYAAKSPEVIIGDTAILAAAPTALKSAGFGDMIAKYVALTDWQIAALLTDEPYCPRVAALTRQAVDTLMTLADKVTAADEYTAGKIFEALLLTGIGMSFTQNSRPASGSEHVIAHLIECLELQENKLPNFHGEDVGVCTLEMLRFNEKLAAYPRIHAHRETVDWEAVYHVYGPMAPAVKACNTPDTVTDAVSPAALEENWPRIREIIRSVPDYATCRAAMEKAGCKLTVADIGKSQALFDTCVKYSPYMRRRLTLLRLRDMISPAD